MELDYYLALLQLHIAVVGVVIAGVVAMIQMLNNTKPHRDVRLLVKPAILGGYGALLAGLLMLLATGSWVSAFPDDAQTAFGSSVVSFFESGLIGLLAIGLMLVSLLWFLELAFRTRNLLDSKRYLQTYVEQTSPSMVHQYLAAIYQEDTLATIIPMDPFQPIREYLKDNAFKYYDYGTADGLRQFSALFDKALASSRRRKADDVEYVRLAQFISENCEEFFRIFNKTNSEKRKIDTIRLLYTKGEQLLTGSHDVAHASLLPIVRSLEDIAKLSEDDDEIMECITRIRQLCDTFLDGHKQHDWAHVAGLFDEICLSVTRISEDYYLQKNNSLKTVPIVGYETGLHRTVTAELVAFFKAYSDIGDRYTDSTPQVYFAAMEGVIEVLFVRLGDVVSNGQQHIGFNGKYHEMARDLYKIYETFGYDAIEHNKPESLGLALSNIRRVIKPAKNYGLTDERQELCTTTVVLAGSGVMAFGDVAIKTDGRTISQYVVEVLSKHATKAQIKKAMGELDKVVASTKDEKHAVAVKRFVKIIESL